MLLGIDWLLSNLYLNQRKLIYISLNTLSFGMYFSLIWLIGFEFLPGKGDDMCKKIVKDEYFTFVEYEEKTS